jgi:hypothetical protein
VNDITTMERRCRRWLRWYPTSFRREHAEEMLGVLMAGAREGQHRPDPMECLSLVISALCMRLRPRVPRSERSVFAAIKVLYLGAVVEVAAVLTILATAGDLRSHVVGSTTADAEREWHAVLTSQLEPLVAAAVIAVAFWLWMAWSVGHGHRWARALFPAFFALNLYGLVNGLVRGSATSARPDLAIGIVLCLVELAAVVFIFRVRSAPVQPGTGCSSTPAR